MGLSMLLGILRLPKELWGGPSDLPDQIQRHSSYLEAADLIERLLAQNDEKQVKIEFLQDQILDIMKSKKGDKNAIKNPVD